MTLTVWLALAFLLVATLGSLAYAALRAWRTWRAFRAASGRLAKELERVAAAGATAEERALALTDGSSRLSGSVERLQASLAHLAALKRAADEPLGTVRLARGAVPRK